MTTVTILSTILLSTLPIEIKADTGLTVSSFGNPKVITVQKFTEDSVQIFARELHRAQLLSQKIIPIVVNSYGGSVFSLMAMVDMIKASKKPVATIVLGKAMSAGAVLLACGHPKSRFAGPHSKIMVHEVSSGAMGKNSLIKATAKEIDKLNTELLVLLAKCSGKPRNYFIRGIAKRSHLDWYMTAKEAKKHGIVDQVKVPVLKTHYRVETTLE